MADGYSESDLSRRQKAALRWTDAYLLDPVVSDDLRQEMLEVFTPAEIVELTFVLLKVHPASKIQVTLGLEPESMPVTVVEGPPSGRGEAPRKAL